MSDPRNQPEEPFDPSDTAAGMERYIKGLDRFLNQPIPIRCQHCGKVHGPNWYAAPAFTNGQVSGIMCINPDQPPAQFRTIHGPHAEGETNELAEHWRKTALEFASDADMWRLRAWTAIIVAALATLALILHR